MPRGALSKGTPEGWFCKAQMITPELSDQSSLALSTVGHQGLCTFARDSSISANNDKMSWNLPGF